MTLPEVTVYLPRGAERRTTYTAVERERREEIRRITDREFDEWRARPFTSHGISVTTQDTDTQSDICNPSTQ